MAVGDLLIFIGGALSAALTFFGIKSKATEKDELRTSLNKITRQLSSSSSTLKVSAAIEIRRFFNEYNIVKHNEYVIEAINIISSLLKILPTGVFQKTLADGIAYAKNLSKVDLQKTNMQDAYLGTKDNVAIILNETDLFLADLSYALIENAVGVETVFYQSMLFNARIKNSSFVKGNFRGADLSGSVIKNVDFTDADFTDANLFGVTFKNVTLCNACFQGTKNLPKDISNNLDEKGCFTGKETFSHIAEKKEKSIYFSMPGTMSKEDELLTKHYKKMLESEGYDVIYYVKDDYPEFGQLGRIKFGILQASAMIAFGVKQIEIKSAKYHPAMENEEHWEDKWLSTPWNELEVGMGIYKGIPILLVKDPSISDGIFDSHLSECFIRTVSTKEDVRTIEQNPQYNEWFGRIQECFMTTVSTQDEILDVISDPNIEEWHKRIK